MIDLFSNNLAAWFAHDCVDMLQKMHQVLIT